MAVSGLEHVNFTVADPLKTARVICDIFGWSIRWEGPALAGGYAVHVGNDDAYLALYSPAETRTRDLTDRSAIGKLNHVGFVVDDLDAVEEKVKAHGFKTHSHADYEPGRRFYYNDGDGIEYEVASYG
ncbi:MAG: VOC family protein [Hoeflea sp.]|uniref:VOC family protein n=1 Tax=Hoeflea sp. TaxID=1940281 RepID=UPI0032EF6241